MDAASDWAVDGGRGALDFDGSNDYVDFGNILNFERTQPFTISAWVRVRSFALPGTIVTKMQASDLRGYFFGFNANRTVSLILRSLLTGNRVLVTTSNAILTLNTWGHVAVTYDGSSSASGVRLYADGLSRASTIGENTLTGTIATSQSLTIAARPGNSDAFANCQMDDIRIFRSVLTAADARQLWQLGRGNMPIVRIRRYTEEAAGGFKAYWARRQSQLIGGGV
jgi:hypothetical protein